MTRIFNMFRWQSQCIAVVLVTLLSFQMATAGCSVAADDKAGSDHSQARLQLTERLENRLQARVRDSIPELFEKLVEEFHRVLADQPESYLNRHLIEQCHESVAANLEEIQTSQLPQSQISDLLQMDADAFCKEDGAIRAQLISTESGTKSC